VTTPHGCLCGPLSMPCSSRFRGSSVWVLGNKKASSCRTRKPFDAISAGLGYRHQFIRPKESSLHISRFPIIPHSSAGFRRQVLVACRHPMPKPLACCPFHRLHIPHFIWYFVPRIRKCISSQPFGQHSSIILCRIKHHVRNLQVHVSFLIGSCAVVFLSASYGAQTMIALFTARINLTIRPSSGLSMATLMI
jgi:hypothetical protein